MFEGDASIKLTNKDGRDMIEVSFQSGATLLFSTEVFNESFSSSFTITHQTGFAYV